MMKRIGIFLICMILMASCIFVVLPIENVKAGRNKLYVDGSVVQDNKKSVKTNLTDRLVGYWNFNEGSGNIVYDSSGNNYDGIIYGASWSDGAFGFGLSFDGQDDYVEVPSINNITNITLNEITIQCWVYLEEYSSEPQQIIEGKTVEHEINLERLSATDIIQFDIVDDNGVMHHITTSPLPQNYWIHLVAIVNGTTQYIYVNGELNNASSWTAPFTITTGFTIGKDNEGANQYFNGKLDEFRIYNRSLNEEEIHNLYKPSIVYVDDDFNSSTPGWGYDHFDKIQDGTNAVNESGTVYVYNGTYYENVVVDKTINLIGENKKTTIIDGGGDVGLNITSNNTFINGFSINNCTFGISLLYHVFYANNITISNNTIYDCGHGILLVKSNNTYILSNTIFNNSGNSIFVQKCNNSNISNNVFYNNSQNGITIKNSLNCNIFSNKIYNNLDLGISIIDSSQNNLIFKNNIINNSDIGVYISGFSSNNLFYHNNLINNTVNAEDESGNIWNNTYPNGGNHWSDYFGEDFYNGPNQDIPGSDGIGDIPYEIPCEHGTDYYPLMCPFEMYYVLDVIPENTTLNEGTVFNVTIKSLGGSVIPEAQVEFNDEIKIIDSNGKVWFTAPQVVNDTYYEITAIKTGYTGANETILIKNMPTEFKKTFMCGRYTNLFTEEGFLTIDVVNLWTLHFSPFELKQHVPPETIKFSIDYLGIITKQFVFGFFNVVM